MRASQLAHGTTTIKWKSGLGLRTDAEILAWRRGEIDDGGERPEFLGAHAGPDEWARGPRGYVGSF